MRGTFPRHLRAYAAMLLTVCAIVGAPAATYAETGEGGASDPAASDLTTLDADMTTWGAAGTESWYITPETDVAIAKRVTCLGQVHLTLRDGVTLTAAQGITVAAGNALTIEGQAAGTGTLVATGVAKRGGACAGIGGDGASPDSGQITIAGGNVTATGARGGAGIGGSIRGTGTVTISGGAVNATGSSGPGGGGTGIGGGVYGAGTIRVSGGHVTARGGSKAAVGGSCYVPATVKTDVAISGGTVDTGAGDEKVAALGNGPESSAASIVITGGSVDAVAVSNTVTNGGKQVFRTPIAAEALSQFKGEYPAYGTVDMTADAQGMYYPWVAPEDAQKPADPVAPGPMASDPATPEDPVPPTEPETPTPGPVAPTPDDPPTPTGPASSSDPATPAAPAPAPTEEPEAARPSSRPSSVGNSQGDVPSSRPATSALEENTAASQQTRHTEPAAEPLPQTDDAAAAGRFVAGGGAALFLLAALGVAMIAAAERERRCAR